MEWLVALIVMVLAGAAIALWVPAVPAKPSKGTTETPKDKEQSAECLRFQPPAQDDVFQCASYYSALARKRMLIWDYRDKRGMLHSGVAPSLEQATQAAREFGYHPSNGQTNGSMTA